LIIWATGKSDKSKIYGDKAKAKVSHEPIMSSTSENTSPPDEVEEGAKVYVRPGSEKGVKLMSNVWHFPENYSGTVSMPLDRLDIRAVICQNHSESQVAAARAAEWGTGK
jgi:hypothetical protein